MCCAHFASDEVGISINRLFYALHPPPKPNTALKKISVRPELVEGLWLRSWWFDKLTTNG